jgi:hypothetical protein
MMFRVVVVVVVVVVAAVVVVAVVVVRSAGYEVGKGGLWVEQGWVLGDGWGGVVF